MECCRISLQYSDSSFLPSLLVLALSILCQCPFLLPSLYFSQTYHLRHCQCTAFKCGHVYAVRLLVLRMAKDYNWRCHIDFFGLQREHKKLYHLSMLQICIINRKRVFAQNMIVYRRHISNIMGMFGMPDNTFPRNVSSDMADQHTSRSSHDYLPLGSQSPCLCHLPKWTLPTWRLSCSLP